MATYRSIERANARWCNVPEESVMSVEHPCIVKNTSKAIDMLGGARGISQSLDSGTERTLALTFRPDDPSSRSILSLHHRTSNVLLKLTVPKRTGRKRKRGSDEPFVEDSTRAQLNATHLVRSIQDNPDAVQVEAVGKISSSHVWRSMPDFVVATQGSAFMKEIETKILPKNYEFMKQYRLNLSYGLIDEDVIPPTVLSTQAMPYHYLYRQTPLNVKAPDATGSVPVNRSHITKTFTHQWQYDSPGVPSEPMKECPSIYDQPPQVQTIVEKLRPLFEERPLWTRRALLNRLPDDTAFFFAKHAMAYVAFTIKSGPWRDTLCRFGVDPRSDPKYRKYQSVFLRLGNALKEVDTDATNAEQRKLSDRDVESHIFTGAKPVPADGKVWQLCDLEDQQLRKLVDVDEKLLRPQCEIRYFGWYPNGVYAKIKVLIKVKVDRIIGGKSLDPSEFKQFLKLPDVVEKDDNPPSTGTAIGSGLSQGYLSRDASKDEMDWAANYRNYVRMEV